MPTTPGGLEQARLSDLPLRTVNVFAHKLILVGSGRCYGSSPAIFPAAELSDGLLDVCCISKAIFGAVLKFAPSTMFEGLMPEAAVLRVRTRNSKSGAMTARL